MILNMFRSSLCSSSGGQLYIYSIWYRHRLQSALNRCTVWQHTEWDDTRNCKYTICPPEDEQSDARNMLRIMM
jgi:hypothetical protein